MTCSLLNVPKFLPIMKTSKILIAATALSAGLYSCTDNGYDLGNIDKSIQVNVNNLVVPLQLDDIKLSTVLDIENNEKVRTINGEYAIVVEGDFKSKDIEIPTFKTSGCSRSTSDQLTKMSSIPSASKRRNAQGNDIVLAAYPLSRKEMLLTASSTDVNKAISKLSGLDLKTEFDITVQVDKKNELSKFLKNVNLENVVVKFPAGVRGTASVIYPNGEKVECTSYDSNTGVLSFEGKKIKVHKGEINIHFDIEGCTKELLDGVIKEIANSDKKEFKLEKKYYIADGYIAVREDDLSDEFIAEIVNGASKQRKLSADLLAKVFQKLPETLEYQTKEELGSFEVTSLSGSIDYSVDNFSLKSMELNDVPSILKETGTRIKLVNPQIYLQLENPVVDANGSIPANTGIKLTSVDKNGVEKNFEIDNGQRINAASSVSQFVLSPNAVDKYYGEYTKSTHVPFTSLSDILNTNGLPSTIKVEATDPRVQDENVNELKLGKNFGKVVGKYTFFAPLELSENSVIAYTDTIADWDDENVKKLTVTNLNITANVTTDAPLEMNLEIWPVDANKKPIADAGRTIIQPKANGQAIELNILGPISNLDGIVIKATAKAKGSGVLRPDMNMHLENLKPRVTGYYDTEL